MDLLEAISLLEPEAKRSQGRPVSMPEVLTRGSTDWHGLQVVYASPSMVAIGSNRVSLQRVDPDIRLMLSRNPKTKDLYVELGSRLIAGQLGGPYQIFIPHKTSGTQVYQSCRIEASSGDSKGLFIPGTLGNLLSSEFGSTEMVDVLQRLEDYLD